jgi:hypothetical protein
MQERKEQEYGSPDKMDRVCQLPISLATYTRGLT